MPAALNKFTLELARNNGVDSLRSAFKQLAKEYRIGKVEVVDNNNVINLFESDYYSRDRMTSVREESLCFYAYQDESKRNWNIAEIHTLLEIAITFYKNYRLNKQLSDAPFTEFMSGLPNSIGLNKIIVETRDQKEIIGNYCVVAFNIKGFSLINKFRSTNYGDLAIKLFAEQVQKLMREGEILSHHASDCFIALIKKDHIDSFVKELNPVTINLKTTEDGEDTFISLFNTIGIVEVDGEYDSFSPYITDSLVAVSHGKVIRAPVVRLDAQLKKDIQTSKNIELSIDEEIKRGTIVTYYQPKVDARTGYIVGTESLARWEKDGAVIGPNVFIPVLEKSGDIYKLDLFILEKACQDISNYRKMGHKTVPLSVNISRIDLLLPGFYREIVRIIKKYNLKYEDIVIEVTETTNLDEKERMVEFVSYLKEHNIKTSLDDFGTGYSSLSSLRDFEVDEIKIDRSFVDRAYTDKDAIIISSILEMANKLGLSVVVEGVETLEQLKFFKNLGATIIQGYYFDKPLPKLDFEERLKEHRYTKEL